MKLCGFQKRCGRSPCHFSEIEPRSSESWYPPHGATGLSVPGPHDRTQIHHAR